MTALDQALETMRRDMSDTGNQSKFYQLFLTTPFFVPTLDEEALGGEGERAEDDQVLPLVIEAEGNDYLLLFDTVERLHAWADGEVKSVEVPGHVLAATTEPPLRWALNVGTDHAKQFLSDEIAWLRTVVERCSTEA
jgi:hypothetical protein